MAAGAFIEGSSIELSADGPLREPFIAYLQGGLSYAHTRYVISEIKNPTRPETIDFVLISNKYAYCLVF